MHARDFATLVHLLGFLAGIALYAMLGAMTLRGRVAARGTTADRVPIATAFLGLVWNVGGLLIYALRDLGLGSPPAWVSATAFSALGLLPAVVVHAAARPLGRHHAGGRALVAGAYGLSIAAALLHFGSAAMAGVAPSRPALIMLTAGYSVVIAVLAVYMRRQPGWRRALSATALAAFAVMALHMSQSGPDTDAWWIELLGHHASIPLAVAILYQDYRFALADLFLKRVLTLVALTAATVALYVTVGVRYVLPGIERDADNPRAAGLLVLLVIGVALMYPWLRRGVHRFVDRVLLRRPDYRQLVHDVAGHLQGAETSEAVLDAVCLALGPAVWARRVTWSADEALRATGAGEGRPARENRGATVLVSTAESPRFVIEIADLDGGRRLLSDDVHMAESLALLAARRIDAIRFGNERLERGLREREALQLATEAELRALRAQLHPHFLFNTLTTIGYLMQEAPERALDTLYRLTGLLRAVLKRSDRDVTTLGEEIALVDAYLGIERARFEERLEVAIDVPAELSCLRVPPLILQPLVENAVKHGISPSAQGGRVVVAARLDGSGESRDTLCLSVSDSGAGRARDVLEPRREGVGLRNVELRLDRHYGGRASLVMRAASTGVGTTVEIRLPAEPLPLPDAAAAAAAGQGARRDRAGDA